MNKFNEFDIIRVMNEAMLKLLKDRNADYSKNQKIKQALEDTAYFFKISKLEAYTVLKAIGIRDASIDNVYKKLIAPDIFFDLLNQGKIKENDSDLIVKYNNYNLDNLFNKK